MIRSEYLFQLHGQQYLFRSAWEFQSPERGCEFAGPCVEFGAQGLEAVGSGFVVQQLAAAADFADLADVFRRAALRELLIRVAAALGCEGLKPRVIAEDACLCRWRQILKAPFLFRGHWLAFLHGGRGAAA
ncbi:hypothetical protein [Leisingera sp. ANG-DT]|uniref:hypothetical protein n=1 Tax=Leisingera sp. ANG-DT TaxID=1577897 RepID=UPI0019D34BF3|nr:hypothetical protein [Leisingera sp. ANG-DT]